METKKIKIIGFWGWRDYDETSADGWKEFDPEDNIFTRILRERYHLEFSDEPDYIIASESGAFPYVKYDAVRILFTGEPFAPDFNVFDYAIGSEYVNYPDERGKNRYYRFPSCFYNVGKFQPYMNGLSYEQAKAILEKKKYFCNFIYGHQTVAGHRERILREIEKYKRVESAGSFLNNMPGGKVVTFSERKIEFLRECKFTIACESCAYPGFSTEKIIDPFCAYSIPVYYGNLRVNEEFNPEAFINLRAYDTLEEGIEKLIEIDQDDEKYLKMLMAPKLASEDYFIKMYDGLKAFLFDIFDQERELAYRRLNAYIQKDHEGRLNEYRQYYYEPGYPWLKRLMRSYDRRNDYYICGDQRYRK